MKTLRPDQTAAIDNVREALRETRRVVLQAPTGFGKTVVASDIVSRVRERSKKVLITVPAISLIDQTVEALWSQGIRGIGVIQANHEMTDWSQPVQVASMATLIKRPKPEADVVIVDECHKWFTHFEGWLGGKGDFEKWRHIPIIGLSATPWTRCLGEYYDRLVIGNTIHQMIEDKTLASFRVYAASHPDLEGIRSNRTIGGEVDYEQADLAERMDRPKLTADIVQSWLDLAHDRPTICFAVNRDHARHLSEKFEEANVPSGYMDCDTPRHERAELRRRFQDGDIRVMCNVDVIGLGVDWPEVSCISYCRPTRSEMRYVQNVGRGLRTANGKDDLLIIDHSDTTLRLGFVSDIHHDELLNGAPKLNGANQVALPKECPACHYLKPPRCAKCPACGHVVAHEAKPIEVRPGKLSELKPGDVANKPKPVADRLGHETVDKARVYGQLRWYQKKHGKADKFADANYKEIYGVWPKLGVLWQAHFEAPDMELAGWLQMKRIAYAKRMEKDRWRDNPREDRKSNGALTQPESMAWEGMREQFNNANHLMTDQDWEDFK